VLLEAQTNAGCVPCNPAEAMLDLPYYDSLCVRVIYHAWWPAANDSLYLFNPAENSARIRYYPPHYDGFRYTPYAWIDGVVRGGFTFSYWGDYVASRLGIPSPYSVSLGGEFSPTERIGNLRITMRQVDSVDAENLMLRVALLEDSVYYVANNGQQIHNHVMRKMIPDTLGTPVSIPESDSVTISVPFVCPEPLVSNNCKLAVWLQTDSTRMVWQAAIIGISQLGPLRIDHPADIPHSFGIEQNYPNPFNGTTVIAFTLETESVISLEVLDILGRSVVALVNGVQPSGRHQIVWDGNDIGGAPSASGVYFCRVSVAGRSLFRQMLLLR